eukprot:gene5122-6376_t
MSTVSNLSFSELDNGIVGRIPPNPDSPDPQPREDKNLQDSSKSQSNQPIVDSENSQLPSNPNKLSNPVGKDPNIVGKTFDEEMGVGKEGTLYKRENNWKGKKTVRLIMERYVYGLVVALIVSFFIIILSLPNWTGDHNSGGYLNIETYSIFYQFASLLFGPIYIALSLTTSYGFKRLKKSKVLYYATGCCMLFIVFYSILYTKGVKYWFYYIDCLGVFGIFVFGQSAFAYKMNLCIQKETIGAVVNKAKAIMTAYNYSAPDIVVTVFTIVYMFFLLPVYFSIQNNILRLGWRLVIHPVYWTLIVMIARQFLTRDISTDDIMLNSNIVLHTFFHHQTLGKIFVYTFSDDNSALTEIGIVISAIEDVILRSVALKRDEWFFTLLIGRQKAIQHVYSQQSLQLRAAILNIQVALEFSGLISAPVFVYMFQKHKLLFHFFDGPALKPLTLFYQTCLGVGLDVISEFVCTYIETRFYRMPIHSTWKWMKANKGFMLWLIYGSVTMGLFGMLWTCGRVPRAGLCTSNDICSCNSIIASSVPDFCISTSSNSTN